MHKLEHKVSPASRLGSSLKPTREFKDAEVETGKIASIGTPPPRGPRFSGIPVLSPSAPKVSSPNAALTAGQPIQPVFGKLKSMITGKNIVPKGVQELRNLGRGYGVGYHKGRKEIVMYNRDGRLAHVKIDAGRKNQSIMLHTRTEKGVKGGQGYMQAMFPEVLKVIHKEFSAYPGIDMAPAPGAATKGLITHLAGLKSRIPVKPKMSLMGRVRYSMAKRFMGLAEESRAQRRKERQQKTSSTSSAKKRMDPNAWSSELMGETAHELNALREMESASPTGLRITGLTGGWAGKLVGPGTPAHQGGAWAWHKSASLTKQGMLQVQLDMRSLPAYVKALPK